MTKKTQPVKQTAKASAINSITKNKQSNPNKGKRRKNPFSNQSHKQYGTSKLEADFAREYLDKLGLKYIYEYEAKDIGRFYDFAITAYDTMPFIMENKHGIDCIKQEGQNVPISFMIEIDGGYYHSDPRVVNDKKLNPMQKHNKVIDLVKTKWCNLHCIPLLRIWEYDIRKNPQMVFDQLNQYIFDGKKRQRIIENKKRPH